MLLDGFSLKEMNDRKLGEPKEEIILCFLHSVGVDSGCLYQMCQTGSPRV
jgi:hypothetical protein